MLTFVMGVNPLLPVDTCCCSTQEVATADCMRLTCLKPIAIPRVLSQSSNPGQPQFLWTPTDAAHDKWAVGQCPQQAVVTSEGQVL